MDIFDVSTAIQEAQDTIDAADNTAATMARLICGRLRSSGVGCSTLMHLKKELRDFNMHTGSWMDR